MADFPVFERQTNDVVIRVTPRFQDEESAPDKDRYVWSYKVEIENKGDLAVQLITRHWKITDRAGRMQEVNGRGVIGQTPIIKPGDTFEYTSVAPLTEPSGLMEGVYGMTVENGGELEAQIPMFALDSPYDSSRPN